MVFTPPRIDVTDGTTRLDDALFDGFSDALETALKGSTDQSPAATTDEVADARGGKSTLGERLDVSLDQNGNLIGSILSLSDLRNGFVAGNMLANDSLMMWSRGDAAAPDYFALSGTGATVARCGVGQADTTVLPNQAHYSAKVTFGSTPAVLAQLIGDDSVVTSAANMFYSRLSPVDAAGLRQADYDAQDDDVLPVFFLSHVWCDGTNRARLAVTDDNGVTAYSAFHPGDSEWHPLVTPAPALNSSSVTVRAQCRVETAGAAYFQCMTVAAGVRPMYVPSLMVREVYPIKVLGNPASGTLDFKMPADPEFILGAQMACVTAPTTSAPTVDLQTPIGGAFASLFTTLPQIAVTKLVGTFQPCNPLAANYRRRVIRGLPTAGSSALQDNSIMKVVYVDDAGDTLRDLVIAVHYLRYVRPFEQFRSMGSIGEA